MKRLALPILAAAVMAVPAVAQWQVHQVDSGRVAIHFFEDTIEQAGLQLELLATAEVGDAFAEEMSAPQAAWTIDGTSDLLFASAHTGEFQPYGIISGSINALGGFILTDAASGNAAEYINFEIHPKPVQNDGPGGEQDPDYMFLTRAGDARGEDFNLCYVKVSFQPGDSTYESSGAGGDHVEPRELRIKAWDMILTATVAERLGRPDLAGTVIGYGKVEADTSVFEGDFVWPQGQNPWTPYGGGPGGDGTDPGGGGFGKDVALGILSSLVQNGHIGSFPNGRAGLSMSTTSCNFGDENVPWLAAMNENHPGIAMQLYREADGRFEQVGISWIKHGFFALSNSQCIPCQNPSPGTFLGVGCSDTYGTSNNSDPFWLGPRDEWDLFTHEWTCLGSYFDGTPVDCDRDQNGGGIGSVNHRLEVDDADLDAGGTYYYEANYLVIDDPYIWNNIGSRRAVPSWNGFQWTFQSGGSGNPLENGPALLRWADADASTTVGLEPEDGNVVLSVNVEDLGNGKWRYEYALFNWNLDRMIRSFSVPACDDPTDLYFHDFDPHAQNEWEATVAGGNITWEWNDVVVSDDMVAGPLGMNHLVNFGFTSTVAPSGRKAVLGVQETGLPGGDLIGADTLAPGCLDLGADVFAPAGGDDITLLVSGGSDHVLFAVLDVGGVPIPAITFPVAPLPFDAFGNFQLTLNIPASVSGIDFGLVAGDVTTNPTSLIELSNLTRIDIQD